MNERDKQKQEYINKIKELTGATKTPRALKTYLLDTLKDIYNALLEKRAGENKNV